MNPHGIAALAVQSVIAGSVVFWLGWYEHLWVLGLSVVLFPVGMRLTRPDR